MQYLGINEFRTYRHEFSGIRIHEKLYIPVNWELSFLFTGIEELTEDNVEEMSIKLSVTFQKVAYWLDNFLNDVILTSTDNNMSVIMLLDACVNSIVRLPSEVSDELFAEALHNKLTVLFGEDFLVGEITIKSSDMLINYSLIPDSDGRSLPTGKYLGELMMYDEPWWDRYDCDTIDLCLLESDGDTDIAADSDVNNSLKEVFNTRFALDDYVTMMYSAIDEANGDLDKVPEIINERYMREMDNNPSDECEGDDEAAENKAKTKKKRDWTPNVM